MAAAPVAPRHAALGCNAANIGMTPGGSESRYIAFPITVVDEA